MKKKKANQKDAIKKKLKSIEDEFEAESQYTNDMLKGLREKSRELIARKNEISARIAAFEAKCKDLQSELEEDQKYEEAVAHSQIDEKLNQVSAAIEKAIQTKPTETKISKLLKATVSVLLD